MGHGTSVSGAYGQLHTDDVADCVSTPPSACVAVRRRCCLAQSDHISALDSAKATIRDAAAADLLFIALGSPHPVDADGTFSSCFCKPGYCPVAVDATAALASCRLLFVRHIMLFACVIVHKVGCG